MLRLSFALLLCLSLSGCIYANVNLPYAYRSPTPADVDPERVTTIEATGEACSFIVAGLVAWGDGGYSAAVDDARRKADAVLLADVKVDRSAFNILGVYQRHCTRVSGLAVR